ncbi:GFA family protein [Paracoccus sp. SY]|uniref:GFA family protein n=1 Tax=Paracoccus sp. SY TaxID=1330255 RepID=UPI000CD168A1|nr:GFA family protein [Paracoccus sp. SY]
MSDFTGRCLCGAVTFSGTWGGDPLRACHCSQCRRWSGHVWAAAGTEGLTLDGPVKWFQSSDQAERGFCPECGSSLFWRRLDGSGVEVAPGAVDNPTGQRLQGHIYVADKGDYYDITDGLPQEQQG